MSSGYGSYKSSGSVSSSMGSGSGGPSSGGGSSSGGPCAEQTQLCLHHTCPDGGPEIDVQLTGSLNAGSFTGDGWTVQWSLYAGALQWNITGPSGDATNYSVDRCDPTGGFVVFNFELCNAYLTWGSCDPGSSGVGSSGAGSSGTGSSSDSFACDFNTQYDTFVHDFTTNDDNTGNSGFTPGGSGGWWVGNTNGSPAPSSTDWNSRTGDDTVVSPEMLICFPASGVYQFDEIRANVGKYGTSGLAYINAGQLFMKDADDPGAFVEVTGAFPSGDLVRKLDGEAGGWLPYSPQFEIPTGGNYKFKVQAFCHADPGTRSNLFMSGLSFCSYVGPL